MSGGYCRDGMWISDHTLAVPLDHLNTDSPAIEVFWREICPADRRREPMSLLLFLQGGPGGSAPRPTASGWWRHAARSYRVILLDQRGTGRSTPVTATSIATMPAEQQADYLSCFRADSIVEDAELIRCSAYGSARWSTLGQSYGGFLTLRYLSTHPEGLVACHTTGGIPSITADAREVYRHTVPLQGAQVRGFYRDFPQDAETLEQLAEIAESGEVFLPSGDLLTVRRLQMLGMGLGSTYGASALHWLLDTALDASGNVTPGFLASLETSTSFWDNPLYPVLQEAIYHQGHVVPGWAAQDVTARAPECDPAARPLFLFGEHMFEWMYREITSMRPFRAVAERLASRTEWPALYDAERLGRNEIPLAALQYYDDPYVPLELSNATLDVLGNSSRWITNEYLHDGLRMDPGKVLPRLFEMTASRERHHA